MKAIRLKPPRAPRQVADSEDGRQNEEQRETLREMAVRLHPRVDWTRMSETAIRQSLGLLPRDCPQRREYEAGRVARGEGESLPEGQSMAFRIGWGHGKPPRARRRRWRPRPASASEQR